MNSNYLLKSFIVFVFIFSSSNVKAQNHEVDLLGLQSIQYSFIDDNSPVFFDGVVHLKSKGTFEGRISLNHSYNKTHAIIVKTNDGYTYIPNDRIDSVVLSKNEKYKQVETKFVTIEGHSKLFREVYNKDSQIIVYDLMDKPFDGRILNDVHIMENGNLVGIFDFWTSGPKKDLINYLNKRDNKKYKRRDFKTLKDLFATL